jgi:hypothetical protein
MKRQTLFFGIFATTILSVPAFAAGDNAGITGFTGAATPSVTSRCPQVRSP